MKHKKTEFAYDEIPINFLSRSTPTKQLGGKSPRSGASYHNMSVPIVQMLPGEKDNMMKAAEKKQLADKALKQKLKSISQGQNKLSKNPSEPIFKKPPQPKGEQVLTGTSYRILRLPSNLPAGYKAQTVFNSEVSSPRFEHQVGSPLGQKLYTLNSQYGDCESPMKGSFVSSTHFADRAKHYKSYASLEINYGAKEESPVKLPVESENENPRLNLRLINSFVKTSPTTLQTLSGAKTPELKVDWHTSTFEGSAGSQALHLGISPKKRMLHHNSVLKLLHGSPDSSPFERHIEEIQSANVVSENKLLDRRGGTSPIKLKGLAQNPSQDRLFAISTDFVRENKSNLILPRINGLEEKSPDFASSEVLATEGNTSKKKKAGFNFGPEISKYLALPKGKSFIIPPKNNTSMIKRLKSMNTKDKIENRVTAVGERSPKKDAKILELKLKTSTTPIHPIFSFEELDEQDKTLQNVATNTLEEIPEEPRGKRNFDILRRKLLRCLKKMKTLKVTPQELLDWPEIFKAEAYAQRGSKAFLEAAKLGRFDEMQELVEKYNRYLIYTFDNVQMTALHFAAKKGSIEIVSFLVGLGANVDAKDMIGRTPLYFAIQHNHIDILKILLANKCSPWSNEEASYTELCKNNLIAWFYLSKMRKLDITLKLTPPNLRDSIWQRESTEILRRKYVAEKGPAQKRLD